MMIGVATRIALIASMKGTEYSSMTGVIPLTTVALK